MQELLRQREQLNKVERDLDSISAMTKVTQRQLNGMKSIFGGIKNWFQSKNESPSPAREEQHSGLKDSLQTYKDISPPPFHPHPASRLYDDDAAAGVSHTGSKQDGIDERLGNHSLLHMWPYNDGHSTTNTISMLLIVILFILLLGILSEGMSVLKNMGLNMNEELSQQNEQITRITGRVDNCEGAVKDQTKQIRTLLR